MNWKKKSMLHVRRTEACLRLFETSSEFLTDQKKFLTHLSLEIPQ